MTLWLHLVCAAYRRPEAFLPTLEQKHRDVPQAHALAAIARFARDHRRVPRVAGLERAPSGRARCRCCRSVIEKHTLRIPLVFYQEGVFDTAGFIHLACAPEYFETAALLDAIRHFTPDADPDDLAEAAQCLAARARGPASAPRRGRDRAESGRAKRRS